MLYSNSARLGRRQHTEAHLALARPQAWHAWYAGTEWPWLRLVAPWVRSAGTELSSIFYSTFDNRINNSKRRDLGAIQLKLQRERITGESEDTK